MLEFVKIKPIGRGLLEVKTSNKTTFEEKRFFCYKSISESELALCYLRNISASTGINNIIKGDDYITTSTIHFELQKLTI